MLRHASNTVSAVCLFMSIVSSPAYSAAVDFCPPDFTTVFVVPPGRTTPISLCMPDRAAAEVLGLGDTVGDLFIPVPDLAGCPIPFSLVDPDPAQWAAPISTFGSNDNEFSALPQCQIRGGGTEPFAWTDATNFVDAICIWTESDPVTSSQVCSAYRVFLGDVPDVSATGTQLSEDAVVCTDWSSETLCYTHYNAVRLAQPEFNDTVSVCFNQVKNLAQVLSDASACADTSDPTNMVPSAPTEF